MSFARIANVVAAQIISALLLALGTDSVFYLVAALDAAFAVVVGLFGIRTRELTLEDVSATGAATVPTRADTPPPVSVGRQSPDRPSTEGCDSTDGGACPQTAICGHAPQETGGEARTARPALPFTSGQRRPP
ncbi:hypothetical protein ACFQ0Q_01275 [Streptomyces aureus]